MYVQEVIVLNQVGLHARPATFFIQCANDFRASIWVEKDEKRVNAKSLLGVLSLGVVGGSKIKIIADGLDEEEAVNKLVSLVESGFANIELPHNPAVGSNSGESVTDMNSNDSNSNIDV